ncbi:hypothetical protein [Photobacterium sp. TY1-4]|nr:hypothetical protein [Photobacterium sp. TY1-4]
MKNSTITISPIGHVLSTRTEAIDDRWSEEIMSDYWKPQSEQDDE